MSWAIIGMGAVSSVGDDVDQIFAALCAGRSGLSGLRCFEPSRFGAKNAYEIDDRPSTGGDVTGRATRWLGRAVEAALIDAGVGPSVADVPILVGTGLRELRSLELWWRGGSAFTLGDLHFGTALRRQFGATDTSTFANACSASLYSLGLAADLLAAEEADTVVVAGVDSITESMFGLLDRVQLEPPQALRPFDRAHRGVLMGEGAAAVVLRRLEHDDSPHRTRAVLRSVAMNCDAHHETAPDAVGIAQAIRDAHARANVVAAEIDLVLLHGTGTVLNDRSEAQAMADVFTDDGAFPLMTAIKSMTGHTSGTSGLLGVVTAAMALDSGRVPPTVGVVDTMDEIASFRLVCGTEEKAELGVAQVNAFGFGGVNAVAVLEKAMP